LAGLSPKQLVDKREDTEELGGYFITNGIERLIRLLIVQRRNHVLALVRSSFQKRGPLYTEFGASIRCARDDQSSQTVTLHYLSDGSITVRFHLRKQEYLIPLMLMIKVIEKNNPYDLISYILLVLITLFR
jgi:DNA-directed RNA polymerase I subunit RPA2